VSADSSATTDVLIVGWYPAADAIRDRLSAAGIAVEDTPSGPRWTLES